MELCEKLGDDGVRKAAYRGRCRSLPEARAAGAKIGLCGQAPSDHSEFAAFLTECEIDSISVSPDSFIAVKHKVAEAKADAAAPRC